ncbi:response regulator [Paenibacillus humicola]|uniref:response regulator n=1 Tax=Paenibacillus humicola TaxID=3110540 RepID=UPI00237B5A5E|nr:response regulator [Paenibacillus humicola]
MFSLLIVEDERWIRKGLCGTIDWEAEGIRLMGEAADGEEALRMVELHAPDIIITDIVMPVMDGIALLQELRKQKLETKVIIMSGYSEFEYARDALKNGAFDYILKPFQEESILDVVRRCVRELKQERAKEAELHTLARSARESMLLARQRLFDMLLSREPYTAGRLEEQLRALRLDLDPRAIRAFAVKVTDWGRKAETARDRALILYALGNIMEETGRRFGPLLAIPLAERKSAGEADLALLQSESPPAGLAEPAIASRLPWLIAQAGQMLGIRIAIGYSEREADLAQLPELYEEALHGVSFWFYDGGGIAKGAPSQQAGAPYFGPAGWDTRFASALKAGDAKLQEQLVRELVAHVHAERERYLPLTVIRGLRLLFQNVNAKQNSHLCRRPSTEEQAVSFRLPLCTLSGLEEALLAELRRQRPESRPQRSRKWIIERALQYMDQHRDEPVTLGDVAEHLYLNHSYFSKIFHEEMGETFSKYIVRSRIERAKQLLKETTLKIYEISAAVGYTDVRHFTKVFKELEGIPPVQFREHGL